MDPMYIFDTDDWTYIGHRRHAFPEFNEWNPTKILPETLMPLASQIAAHVIYPLSGDLIQSLNYMFAIVFALCISLYFLLLIKVLKEDFGFGAKKCFILFFPIILFHFCPIINNENVPELFMRM